MRRWLLALLLTLGSIALWMGLSTRAAVEAQAVPEIQFDGNVNFLKLPTNQYFGEVAGVAVNSKGQVMVFSRGNVTGPAYAATAAQLLEFGPDGTFLREVGHNLYAWSYAHAVRYDKHDNIWAIDKGSDMVIRFNPAGRVTMVFGRKKEASDESAEPWKRNLKPPLPPVNGQFRQPTDVAWDPQDNIFISDGYVNSRVANFDKNGDWVRSFGEPGSGPGQFNTVHSIAADAKGNLYVADRANRRIQVWDSQGTHVRDLRIEVPVPADAKPWMGAVPNAAQMAAADAASGATLMSPGAPWAVCITPGPNQVLYAADAFPGRVYKMSLDGRVLGYLGNSGRQAKQFGWIHEIACPSENTLYVAELLNWRVQKLTLYPNGRPPATTR